MKSFMLGPCGNISPGLQYSSLFCVRGREVCNVPFQKFGVLEE